MLVKIERYLFLGDSPIMGAGVVYFAYAKQIRKGRLHGPTNARHALANTIVRVS